jgi:hypothetical protein
MTGLSGPMQFGTLSENAHINARIHGCLDRIDPCDVPAFVRKFRTDSTEQCFHTYRELILGAHLRSRGWNARYEYSIAGRKPDWVLLNEQNEVTEIIDAVTVDQRRVTAEDIKRSLSSGGVWTGWLTMAPDHLYSKLVQKAGAYASLAEHARLPYVVAPFSTFIASIDEGEVHHVLYELHSGVFAQTPTLAGVIFFREQSNQYAFTDFPNPKAIHPSALVRDALSPHALTRAQAPWSA